MKRTFATLRLMTVISLCLGVIWLGPAYSAGAPSFASLGELRAPGMAMPRAMDLDAAGNLYVADAELGNGKVFIFSQYGELLRSLDLQANGLGLAVSADGSRLFVSQRGGSVAVFDPTSGEKLGVLSGAVTEGSEFGAAGEIEIDAAGEFVYVADDAKRFVNIYHVSGGFQARVGGTGTGAGTFSKIGGMTLDPAGRLVVADANHLNFKVHIISLNSAFAVGSVTTYANTNLAVFGKELSSPRGITFDDLGRGYFLEFITSEIRAIDVSGAAYVHRANYGAGLMAVGDVVYDAANRRLFVSCDGGRIVVLGIDGGSNPVKINRAPTTPVPQSPIGGSVVDTAFPGLTFANATDEDGDALSYQVVVSSAAGVVFQATAASAPGASTTVAVSGAGLEENAAFTWTVQAFDGEKSSDVSAPAAFVVNATDDAPSVPVLVSPLSGEPYVGQDALIWGASTDPDPNDTVVGYRVELSLSRDFAELAAVENVAVTSLSIGDMSRYDDLIGGAVYFWRVSAYDREGTASMPSAVGSFTYNTATLRIKANMPGAKIYLSGNHGYAGAYIGEAPLRLRDLPQGSYSLVVERSGFERFVTSFDVENASNLELYAELMPALKVTSLINIRHSINGRAGLAVNGSAAPYVVDFDNDGNLDLLVGDAEGIVRLFPSMGASGLGRLTVQPGVEVLRAYEGIIPFVADWNNDGRKDVIAGMASGVVKVFLNVGSNDAPAFARAGQTLLAGGAVLQVAGNAAPAIVDLNGDGAKDLVVGDASGRIVGYINVGDDAQPAFDEGRVLLQLNSAAVPFPVDWDADGSMDLLVTSDRMFTFYRRVSESTFVAVQTFRHNSERFTAVFPVAMAESGKELLVGRENGQVIYLFGKSDTLEASFLSALREKVAELAEWVADTAPDAIENVILVDSLVASGNLVGAAQEAALLLTKLPAGKVLDSATELSALLERTKELKQERLQGSAAKSK